MRIMHDTVSKNTELENSVLVDNRGQEICQSAPPFLAFHAV